MMLRQDHLDETSLSRAHMKKRADEDEIATLCVVFC